MDDSGAVNALILAGRANEGVFKDISPATNEALIDIGGRAMVDYVLDAATRAATVSRVLVVGREDVRPHLPQGVDLLQGGSDVIDNVVLGIRALGVGRPVLVLTSDIPFLTSEVIDTFVRQCLANPADLHYPAISQEVNEQRFPGVKRTYAKLREGVYTGGNVFLVNPSLVPDLAGKAKAFVAARKSVPKMASLLGPGFVIKMLLGTLSLQDLEVKVSSMLGIKGAVIVSESPEIGVDVDKLSDLELARKALAG
jgi:GTP:adenosylcobinamide-phosphate guanylyltransferase